MVPALHNKTDHGHAEPCKPILFAFEGGDKKDFSFGFQIDAPTRVASSVVRRLPGTARRNNARAYFCSGLRPFSSKSVPNALFGLVIDFKRVMPRSLVCQDFRNERQLPLVRRRLHAPTMVHGDVQCLSTKTRTAKQQTTKTFGEGA